MRDFRYRGDYSSFPEITWSSIGESKVNNVSYNRSEFHSQVFEKPVWGVVGNVGSRSGLIDSRQTFINFIFIHKLVGRSLARGVDFTKQK